MHLLPPRRQHHHIHGPVDRRSIGHKPRAVDDTADPLAHLHRQRLLPRQTSPPAAGAPPAPASELCRRPRSARGTPLSRVSRPTKPTTGAFLAGPGARTLPCWKTAAAPHPLRCGPVPRHLQVLRGSHPQRRRLERMLSLLHNLRTSKPSVRPPASCPSMPVEV